MKFEKINIVIALLKKLKIVKIYLMEKTNDQLSNMLKSFSSDFHEQNLNKKCCSLKFVIFILISVIICLFVATITLLILYLKISENQKNILKSWEAKVKDLENTISSLKKENLECNTNLKDYKTKYENLEIKVKDLENTISTLEKENLECNTNLNNCKNDFNSCQKQLDDCNDTFENHFKVNYDYITTDMEQKLI